MLPEILNPKPSNPMNPGSLTDRILVATGKGSKSINAYIGA